MGREILVARTERLEGGRFFSPNDISVLKDAVEQAWRILSSNGVGESNDARLILAEGVLAAAHSGEREMIVLSLAACRYWTRSATPKRSPNNSLASLIAVH